MKKLIVASNNEHKILEIKAMLSKFDLQVLSLKEAGIDVDVEENGVTFMENALIKARAIKALCDDALVLSDDSGLAVDALGGAPGIYSARYCGEHGNDIENNKKLIKEMEGIPFEKRTAKFVCAMALILNDNKEIKVQGEVEGIILEKYEPCKGFGYDPLFYVPSLKATFNDVSGEVKNSMSHRGKSLEKLVVEIKKYI